MLFIKPKKDKQEEIKKNSLQNPKILEVNLIKGETRISFDWGKNLSVLLVVLFIAGSLVAEIYFGLDWWATQEALKAGTLSDNIASVNREISNLKGTTDKALSYKDKSVELGKLLSDHIYFSNLFNWLEKNTLSTVKFDSFTGDNKGTYVLNARALSYSEVSWQVKAFLADPIVKKVEVSSVNSVVAKEKNKETSEANKAVEQGVNFSLDFQLDPSIFKK
jgi:hypothetical protein